MVSRSAATPVDAAVSGQMLLLLLLVSAARHLLGARLGFPAACARGVCERETETGRERERERERGLGLESGWCQGASDKNDKRQ